MTLTKKLSRTNKFAIMCMAAFGLIAVEASWSDAEAARCSAGQTLYKAKNGKGFCCPSGTKGYYNGYTGIVCKRPQGFTKHQARRVCQKGHTLYDAKNGVGYCCPPGTKGFYNGRTGITCKNVRNTRTKTVRRSRCARGHTLYNAKNGKGFCCPPGTKGYYKGYTGITCHRTTTTTRPTTTSRTSNKCSAGFFTFRGNCCPSNKRGRTSCPRGFSLKRGEYQHSNRIKRHGPTRYMCPTMKCF